MILRRKGKVGKVNKNKRNTRDRNATVKSKNEKVFSGSVMLRRNTLQSKFNIKIDLYYDTTCFNKPFI